MSGPDKEKVQERLNAWITEIVGERLKPLVDLAAAKDVAGLARGIAFRLSENLGILRRDSVSEEVRSLDQPARAQLRGYGVRFGAFNIYFPALLKPAAVELALTLWLLKHGAESGLDAANPPTLPRPGLTSLLVDKALPPAFYRVAGFHPCGTRAVRIDMLERLADLIRPLVAWRPDPAGANPPPKGATGDGGFRVTPDMMSILGCSSSNVGEVLQELGFRLERVPVRIEAPARFEAGASSDRVHRAAGSRGRRRGRSGDAEAADLGAAQANGESEPAMLTRPRQTVAAEGSGGEIAASAEMVVTGRAATRPLPRRPPQQPRRRPRSHRSRAQERRRAQIRGDLAASPAGPPSRAGARPAARRSSSLRTPSVAPAKDANKADKGEARESSHQRRGKEARDDQQARDGRPKRHDQERSERPP